jgi:putative ABC transport system substrate-binding protein
VERRTFLAGTGAVLLAAPLAAEAQQAGKVPRIAFITTQSPDDPRSANAFRQGLRDLGYVDGRNIIIEYRWGRGSTEQFPAFAAELVRLKVDVIVAGSSAAGMAAKRETRSIPILIPTMADPVGEGFAASLARPGGNITGLARQDVTAKQVQLLKETIPSASSITLLVDTSEPSYRQAVSEAEVAAAAIGVKLRRQEVSHADELEGAFASVVKSGGGPIIVVGGTLFSANRPRLVEGARKNRLPMMCYGRPSIESGCLMSYSPDVTDLFRRAATYVDKILKGAKPADLPVEQAEKFEFVINLKTAKALGLTIPPSLLGRADEVIQ